MARVGKAKNPATMSAQIKELRTALKLSQQKAAEKFGCSVSRWAQWERGKGEPQGLYRAKLDQWMKSNRQSV